MEIKIPHTMTMTDLIIIMDGVKCPSCGKQIRLDEFRNDISLKEWRLSRLCQECQDSVFGVD